MKDSKTLSVTVPEGLYEEICLLARGVHRTRTAYVRQIIRAYLLEIKRDPSKKVT